MADNPASGSSTSNSQPPIESMPWIQQNLKGDHNQIVGQAINSIIVNVTDGGQVTISSQSERTLQAQLHTLLAEPKLTNLPSERDSFIGREHELSEIRRLFLSKETRLITLVGPGGIGKTRLAKKIANTIINHYKNGVWLVDLVSFSDPSLIPQIVGRVFGLQDQIGISMIELVTNYLKVKELLLIVDNCEHLIDACAEFTDHILSFCENIQILATSRESLKITGEVIWAVPALKVFFYTAPSTENSHISNAIPLISDTSHTVNTMQEVLDSEAVRLFYDRLRLKKHDIKITEEDVEYVTQICQRLDGIPLAIEIAAARASKLKIKQILDRLDDRFRLLTDGYRNRLPRHKTLRALVDWSYFLLTDLEKLLLQRLAVFAGSWTLQAAEVVCICSQIEPYDVLELLDDLVDKSLVITVEQEEIIRYQMLETIREYALDKLEHSGDIEQIQQQHLAYFLTLVEEIEPKLKGAEQIDWFHYLEVEYVNLRIALTYALKFDEEAGLCLAAALGWFWEVRGYLREGREWLSNLLNTSKNQSKTAIRANALAAAARLAFGQSDYDAMKMLGEECWDIAQAVGDKRLIAIALLEIGSSFQFKGEYKQAHAFKERSLELAREAKDNWIIVRALISIGDIARWQRNLVEARACHEESLMLSRKTGDIAGIALSLIALGCVDYAQENYSAAYVYFTESLELRQKLGDKMGIAQLLNNLGEVVQYQGDYVQAQVLHTEGLNLRRELGDQEGIGFAIQALGELLFLQAKYEDARKYFTEALVLRQDLGNKYTIAHSLYSLGRTVKQQGDINYAIQLFEESLKVELDLGSRNGVANNLEGLAGIASMRQQPLHAARLFGAAAALRQSLGLPLQSASRPECIVDVNTAQTQLDQTTWAEVWSRGQNMSLEQAVSYALNSLVQIHNE